MAVGTDLWNWSLAREELLPVTIQASCMFRKFSYIRKSSIALPNFLPVFGGKLMTRATREVFSVDVSGVRKTRVVNNRLAAARLRTVLAFSGDAAQKDGDG